jgi:hypothetical protein
MGQRVSEALRRLEPFPSPTEDLMYCRYDYKFGMDMTSLEAMWHP